MQCCKNAFNSSFEKNFPKYTYLFGHISKNKIRYVKKNDPNYYKKCGNKSNDLWTYRCRSIKPRSKLYDKWCRQKCVDANNQINHKNGEDFERVSNHV